MSRELCSHSNLHHAGSETHLAHRQLNRGQGTQGSQSDTKKLFYFSSRATLQDCEKINSLLSQINLLRDRFKTLLLLKYSQTLFSPCYPPRFLILSTYCPPRRSRGVGQTIRTPEQSGGVRQTPKCLSLQSNSPRMGRGKPCETLRHN